MSSWVHGNTFSRRCSADRDSDQKSTARSVARENLATHAGWYVDMMDLRSASRVLRPRQFQEIKEVIKSSHVLPARSQKTKVWATDRPSDFRRFARRECP
ncbi:hypothetical protein TNCV_701591 [Trichonephila clavipes]|nr:hypothetical protein TNCV_701591 [Trichonephila clavipes]